MTLSQGDMCFCLAGLEVRLQYHLGGTAAALLGDYRHYPSSGAAPGLVIELERSAGFSTERKPGPAHPGFDRRMLAAGELALSRWDAEGTVRLPTATDAPVRASFRLSDNPNAAEAVIRACTSIALPRRGGLILHASAIVDERGNALVFSGHSGAGKSTIAKLLTAAPWNRPAISDELLIVARALGSGGKDDKSAWRAHVTPFIGSSGLKHGTSYPLVAMHFLEQAATHKRSRLSHGEALTQLTRNALAYVCDLGTAQAVLELATELTGDVPAHRLLFAKDSGVGGVLDITC